MARQWDDLAQDNKKNGRFSVEEEAELKHALESVRQEMGYDDSEFYEWITKPKSNKGSFWPKIAEALPDRSVRSVKNFCQRRFHPNNYKGKWTPQEEQQLRQYVKDSGDRWGKIASLMNRTEHNVRDKWRELNNKHKPEQGSDWNLKRVLRLVKMIEEQMDIKILENIENIEEEFRSEFNNLKETKKRRGEKSIEQLAIKKVIHDHLIDDIEEVSKINILDWKNIASAFKPKFSTNECRNKWFLLFKYESKYKTKVKHRYICEVLDRLIEVVRMDKNRHGLEHYKVQPEFAENSDILNSILLHKKPSTNLLDYLKSLRANFNKNPLYRIKKPRNRMSNLEMRI